MSNLRIIYDNAIDKATLTSTSYAGTLGPSNLQSDTKSKVWRSVSTNGTITATWSTSVILSGVIFPFCNFTSNSVMRVRGYLSDVIQFDITVNPAPYIALGEFDWGSQPLGVNAYSYGLNTYARCWFSNSFTLDKIVVDLDDPSNPAGYIEMGRMVSGQHWTPTYNTSFGISISFADSSVHERTQSGNMVTTVGTRYKKLLFDLNWLTPNDRVKFNVIMKKNGMTVPMYINLFPNDTDTEKEQTYQIYGKLTQIPDLTHPIFTIYSAQILLEEI